MRCEIDMDTPPVFQGQVIIGNTCHGNTYDTTARQDQESNEQTSSIITNKQASKTEAQRASLPRKNKLELPKVDP